MSDFKKPKPKPKPIPRQRGRKIFTKLGYKRRKEKILNILESSSLKAPQNDEPSHSKGLQQNDTLSSKGPQDNKSSRIKQLQKNKTLCSNVNVPSSSKQDQGPNNVEPSSSKRSQEPKTARYFAGKRVNRLVPDGRGCSRYDICLKDERPQVGPRNLVPNSNFLVSFRVYAPFFHRDKRESLRPGKCTQQITVLDRQPLTSLRDMIVCEADFQDVRGDISDQPESPVAIRARSNLIIPWRAGCLWPWLSKNRNRVRTVRLIDSHPEGYKTFFAPPKGPLADHMVIEDLYPSGMFYFDDTFYVDSRSPDHTDYSVPIREWARQIGISIGKRRVMERTRIDALTLRFGYPYVFIHQGNCEHTIIVSDARCCGISIVQIN